MRRSSDRIRPGRGLVLTCAASGVFAARAGLAQCAPGVERFGERLLGLDERTAVVASPYALGGAGWCGVVELDRCEVLQEWSGAPGEHLGWSLAAGDLDGDGWLDLCVGAPGVVTGSVPGSVRGFRGGPGAFENDPAWIWRGASSGERFGESVALLDADADGHVDLAVGSGTYTGAYVHEGLVRLYAGTESGPEGHPVWAQVGRSVAAGFGRSLASGDFDGDGWEDLLVGAPEASSGENREGRAEIFPGGGAGLASFPSWRVEGGEPYAYLGACVAAIDHWGPDAASGWAVGGPWAGNDHGRVWVFPPAAPWVERRAPGDAGTAERCGVGVTFWSLGGGAVGELFGASLSAFHAAGLPGLIVGAPGAASGRGRADAFLFTDEGPVDAGSFDGAEREFLGTALAAAGPGSSWIGAPWSGEGGRVLRWAPSAPAQVRALSAPAWDLALAPHPIESGTCLRITGAVSRPVEVRWYDVAGACIFGPVVVEQALAWSDLRRGTLPRTGWVEARAGTETRALRWVDLRSTR